MISRIDHIAIAVKDYDKAYNFFSTLLGAVPGSSSTDDNMKYLWQNLYLGDLSRLELLTPVGAGSFLEGFLSKKEGGVHHISLQTPDIKKAAGFLDRQGIPYFGYREYGTIWKELFIHPKHAFGVLIQIAEFNADDWLAPAVRMPMDLVTLVTIVDFSGLEAKRAAAARRPRGGYRLSALRGMNLGPPSDGRPRLSS